MCTIKHFPSLSCDVACREYPNFNLDGEAAILSWSYFLLAHLRLVGKHQLSLSCMRPHLHVYPLLAAPNEAAAFTTLMKELYQRAKAQSPPLLVTAAMRASPLALKHYELSKVHKYLDTIFLMSYDYNGALGMYELSMVGARRQALTGNYWHNLLLLLRCPKL